MNEPLTVNIPITAEILVRFQGSEELHMIGTVRQEFPVDIIAAGPKSPTTIQFEALDDEELAVALDEFPDLLDRRTR